MLKLCQIELLIKEVSRFIFLIMEIRTVPKLTESPEARKTNLLFDLSRESHLWMRAKRVAERSGGNDGHAVRGEKMAMDYMNRKLEALFEVMQEITAAELIPIEEGKGVE